MTKIKIQYAGIFLLFGVFPLLGCNNSDTIPVEIVHGTVTLDGEPADDVSVTFTSKDGSSRAAIGRTNECGTFEMITGGSKRNGVMAGDYHVTFVKYILVAPDGRPVESFPVFNPDGSPANRPEFTMKHTIPKKYGDRNNPLFEAVVERGKKNVYTFELEGQ